MRIAILNRRRDTHPGGDLTQIDATIEALGKYGVVAEYAPEGWDTKWLRGFDLAHIFHCNFGWSIYNYEMVMKGGVPYVVTPIFYPTTELGADAGKIREILGNARCVFPNSSRERREIVEVLAPGEDVEWVLGHLPPLIPIPNGTDTLFWGTFDTHDERSGVICVTPRPGDKNTDLVARVCDRLQIPLRVVSGIEDRHELAKIYWGARVFVNASTSERMSLTTGEALVAGCRVIDTRENRGNEWYGSHLVRFDPLSEDELQGRLTPAYHHPSWNYSPNRAAQRITWPWVAKELIYRYEKALKRG